MRKKRYIQPIIENVIVELQQMIAETVSNDTNPITDPSQFDAKEITFNEQNNYYDEDDPDYNPLTYHGYDGGYKGYNPWED